MVSIESNYTYSFLIKYNKRSLHSLWITSTALDVVLYGAHFEGMKLAGMILIAVGFFLVMFPDNWPDYITRLLR